MIDVQQVRELAEVMAEHGLTEIRIRDGERLVTLRKGPLGQIAMWPQGMSAPQPATPPAALPAETSAPAAIPDNLIPIVSPMVGTFYGSPDPESPPFVTVGAEIDANTTVCIIEAMKVFNEIKAEVSGVVERILAQDEQAVEYGQPLMMIRPRG